MNNNNSTSDFANQENDLPCEENLSENKCNVPKYEYLENNEMCIICYENPFVFFKSPCGHKQCCSECIGTIVDTNNHDLPAPKCPLCRKQLPHDLRKYTVLFKKLEDIENILKNGYESHVDNLKILLHYACYTNHIDLVLKLICLNEIGFDINDFIIAIKNGSMDVVEYYFDKWDHQYIANEFDQNGMTPLMVAVANGQFELVQILISRGALINKSNPDNNVHSLMMACVHSNDVIANYLCKMGANMNQITSDGFTPLKFAIQMNSTPVVMVLFNHNADTKSLTPEEFLNYQNMISAECYKLYE